MRRMIDLDHWQEIGASLWKNWFRTLLTAFGVSWGIFMLVVMLGSGSGLRNGVVANFSDGATNSIFVWTNRTSMPYKGLPTGRSFEYGDADYRALLELPEAEVVAPRLQLGGFRGGNNVTRGTKAGAFEVMGDVPAIEKVESFDILAGRFLHPLDLTEKRKVAVIGTRVRDVLFGEEPPIGDAIKINGVYFKVVGVHEPGTVDAGDADRNAQRIYIPLSTFQTAFNYGDRIGWFTVTSRPEVSAEQLEESIVRLLKERHKIHPEDTRAIGFYNLGKEFAKTQGLFRGIGLLVWIVGIGTLSAGVIGVSNIMLIVVKERTAEIGLRRAIGATPFDITLQIVMESAVLTAVAGYIGLVIGVGVLEMARSFLASSPDAAASFRNPGIDLGTALAALAILVVAGVLAGLLPAQRALAIAPVEALRSE